MLIAKENFSRRELFELYNSRQNPFSFVTTKLDVTNVYNYCKEHGNHYATFGYIIAKAMNMIPEFTYRYENENFYKYDQINPNFTQQFANGTIGFFTVTMKDEYEEFIKEFKTTEQQFLESGKSIENPDSSRAEVWLSIEPWFNFTGLVTPFDKSIAIPQVIWDRYSIEENKCYIDLMIMSHHGFVDGSHIGEFINNFIDIVSNFAHNR